MKKTVALIIAFSVLFCLAACGQTQTVQAEEPETAAVTEIRPDYGELYVVLDGVSFGVMDEADPVTDALGVATQQGVRIGMNIEEAIGLLGDGYENSGSVYRYRSGTTLLSLNTDSDGTVSDIQFSEYTE